VINSKTVISGVSLKGVVAAIVIGELEFFKRDW
jgi:hypothetical protein